jgi:methyl-accepting chemotaxis protein/methyl-accepting chemotaxis protein-1 (serine sensor receptor)
MNRYSIQARLTVLVAALIGLLIATLAAGLASLHQANERLGSVYNDRVVPLRQLKSVADGYAVAIVDAAHKVRDGALQPQQALAGVQQARQDIGQAWAAFRATELVDEERRLVERADPLMRRADEAVNKLGGLLAAGDIAAVGGFAAHELYPAIDPVSQLMDQLTKVQLRVAEEHYHAAVQA